MSGATQSWIAKERIGLGAWAFWALLAVSLDLALGYAGIVTLGHGAFFGLGIYTTATLAGKLDVPFLWTLPAAGIVAARPSVPVRRNAPTTTIQRVRIAQTASELRTRRAGFLRIAALPALAQDASGAIFVADTANHTIRRIDLQTGVRALRLYESGTYNIFTVDPGIPDDALLVQAQDGRFRRS